VEPQEYDDMMRRMLAIVIHMDTALEDLRAAVGELKEFNRQQLAINARLETLLSRVLRNGADNGREA
jgi:uncharacterized membrane protein